jgi:small GTP-binding protein
VHKHDENDSISSANVRHKIVVMGAEKVGKTSLITQFLYQTFSLKYKRTVEEMYRGDFCVAGVSLTLDILDTSGADEVICGTANETSAGGESAFFQQM